MSQRGNKEQEDRQAIGKGFKAVTSGREVAIFLRGMPPITPLQALMNVVSNRPEAMKKVAGKPTVYLEDQAKQKPPFVSFEQELARVKSTFYDATKTPVNNLEILYSKLLKVFLTGIKQHLSQWLPEEEVNGLCDAQKGCGTRAACLFDDKVGVTEDEKEDSQVKFSVAALRLLYQDPMYVIVTEEESASKVREMTEEDISNNLYVALFFLDALADLTDEKADMVRDLIARMALIRRGSRYLRDPYPDRGCDLPELRGHLLHTRVFKQRLLCESLSSEEFVLPALREAIRESFGEVREALLRGDVNKGVKRAWTLTLGVINRQYARRRPSSSEALVTTPNDQPFSASDPSMGIRSWRDWEESLAGARILSELKCSVIVNLQSTTVTGMPTSDCPDEQTLYKQLIGCGAFKTIKGFLCGDYSASGLTGLSSVHLGASGNCPVSLFLDFLLDALMKGYADTYALFNDAMGLDQLSQRYTTENLALDASSSQDLIMDSSSLVRFQSTALVPTVGGAQRSFHVFVDDDQLPDPDVNGVTRLRINPNIRFTVKGSDISPKRTLLFSSTEFFDLPAGFKIKPGMIIALGLPLRMFSDFTEFGKQILMTAEEFYTYYEKARAGSGVLVGPHYFDPTQERKRKDVVDRLLIEPIDLTRLDPQHFSVRDSAYLFAHCERKINDAWLHRSAAVSHEKDSCFNFSDYEIVGGLIFSLTGVRSVDITRLGFTKASLTPNSLGDCVGGGASPVPQEYHVVDGLTMPVLWHMGMDDFSGFCVRHGYARVLLDESGDHFRTIGPDLDLRNLHPRLMLSLPKRLVAGGPQNQIFQLGNDDFFRACLLSRNHFHRDGNGELIARDRMVHGLSFGFYSLFCGFLQLVRLMFFLPRLPDSLSEEERSDIRHLVTGFKGLLPTQAARDYLHFCYAERLEGAGWSLASVNTLFGRLPEAREVYFESMELFPFFGTRRQFDQVAQGLLEGMEEDQTQKKEEWRQVLAVIAPHPNNAADGDDLKAVFREMLDLAKGRPRCVRRFAQFFLRPENAQFLGILIDLVEESISEYPARNSYRALTNQLKVHIKRHAPHRVIARNGQSEQIESMLRFFDEFYHHQQETRPQRERLGTEMECTPPNSASPLLLS